MFERFTDRARKVMILANQTAQRLHHEYIGTEHILLGLVQEGSGVGANVLKNLDVDMSQVRLEVEKVVKPGQKTAIVGKLPQTPRAKKVLEHAIMEARNLNHNYVGTEHLLLGLLGEEDGTAAQVLMNLGLNLEAVRNEVLNLLGAGHALAAPSEGTEELLQGAIEYLEAAGSRPTKRKITTSQKKSSNNANICVRSSEMFLPGRPARSRHPNRKAERCAFCARKVRAATGTIGWHDSARNVDEV